MRCHICGSFKHEATTAGCPKQTMTYYTAGDTRTVIYKFTQKFFIGPHGEIVMEGIPTLEIER